MRDPSWFPAPFCAGFHYFAACGAFVSNSLHFSFVYLAYQIYKGVYGGLLRHMGAHAQRSCLPGSLLADAQGDHLVKRQPCAAWAKPRTAEALANTASVPG